MQFLAALSATSLVSLEALNRAFWGWIEGEYHQAPHRGLDGECPADRWARQSDEVRLASGDLGDLFLFEQKRKVQKDRTVSLDGVLYGVDAALAWRRSFRPPPVSLGESIGSLITRSPPPRSRRQRLSPPST